MIVCAACRRHARHLSLAAAPARARAAAAARVAAAPRVSPPLPPYDRRAVSDLIKRASSVSELREVLARHGAMLDATHDVAACQRLALLARTGSSGDGDGAGASAASACDARARAWLSRDASETGRGAFGATVVLRSVLQLCGGSAGGGAGGGVSGGVSGDGADSSAGSGTRSSTNSGAALVLQRDLARAARASLAGARLSSPVEPWLVSACIAHAASVDELSDVVEQFEGALDAAHDVAACLRAAALLAGGGGPAGAPGGAASVASRGTSSGASAAVARARSIKISRLRVHYTAASAPAAPTPRRSGRAGGDDSSGGGTSDAALARALCAARARAWLARNPPRGGGGESAGSILSAARALGVGGDGTSGAALIADLADLAPRGRWESASGTAC